MDSTVTPPSGPRVPADSPAGLPTVRSASRAPIVAGGGYLDLDPRTARRYHAFWALVILGWLLFAAIGSFADRLVASAVLVGWLVSLLLAVVGVIGVLIIRRSAPRPPRRGDPRCLYG